MLECLLAGFTWRRGWGAKTLIPFGISIVLQILLVIGGAGMGAALLVAVIDMLILGVMWANPPARDERPAIPTADYAESRS